MNGKKKILIFPIILAWLVIFIHDTIPHDHHSVFACISQHEHEETEGLYDSCCQKYQHDESDQDGCHFSVEFLSQFSIDQDFDLPAQSFNGLILANNGLYPYCSDHLKTKPFYLVQNHMRAPPAV
jgi:hypothetical protein